MPLHRGAQHTRVLEQSTPVSRLRNLESSNITLESSIRTEHLNYCDDFFIKLYIIIVVIVANALPVVVFVLNRKNTTLL